MVFNSLNVDKDWQQMKSKAWFSGPYRNVRIQEMKMKNIGGCLGLHPSKILSTFTTGNIVTAALSPDDPPAGTICQVVPETRATLVATDRSDNSSIGTSHKLKLHVQKRSPFIFTVNSNNSITSVFNCNNCVSPVADQKLSLYCGAYATKYDNASETVATTILNNFIRFQSNCYGLLPIFKNRQHQTDFSLGIGLPISSARASTSNVTVGAPMAAYLARGNRLFAVSHQTEPLPLSQAIHFLQGELIYTSIYANGTVSASIHNYVYRNHAR